MVLMIDPEIKNSVVDFNRTIFDLEESRFWKLDIFSIILRLKAQVFFYLFGNLRVPGSKLVDVIILVTF